MKKTWIIAGALVVVGGGVIVYQKASASSQGIKYVTSSATKGTLVSSISGSGNIIVDQLTKVTPSITGTVSNLAVKLSDKVSKGQTLFTIVNNQLDVTVNKSYGTYLQAKQGVSTAQSQLITARATSQNQTLDSGQAKAQAGLDQANQGLSQAQNQLAQDQANLTSPSSKIALDQQAVTVAQDNLTASQIAQQQTQTSGMAAVQAAQQQVSAAEQGVQLSVKNEQTALADYTNQKQSADQRTVTSPIDGTITSLSVSNGDQLGSGATSSTTSSSTSTTSTAAVVIADLTSLKATIQVSEIDTSKVQSGQKTSMTFDAIDGLTLTGKVEKIDTVGAVSQGVVTYTATMDFDSLDPRVRPGMSTAAAITTNVVQDALLVPSGAVKTATDGSFYVQILQKNLPIHTAVGIGAISDTQTQITSGLNEDDAVVTQTIVPSSTKSPSIGSGNALSSLSGGGGLGRAASGGSSRSGN